MAVVTTSLTCATTAVAAQSRPKAMAISASVVASQFGTFSRAKAEMASLVSAKMMMAMARQISMNRA